MTYDVLTILSWYTLYTSKESVFSLEADLEDIAKTMVNARAFGSRI